MSEQTNAELTPARRRWTLWAVSSTTPSASAAVSSDAQQAAAAEPDLAGRRVTVAPSWRRALAGVIDILVCLPPWALLAWLTFPGDLPEAPWNWLDTYVDWFNADRGVLVWPLVSMLLVGFAYNAAFMAFGREPLGRRALKLRTEDATGAFPDRRRALVYCGLRVLSTAVLALGHLWALADPARRTLHDRLAGIWVTIAPPTSKAEGSRPETPGESE